MKPVSARGTGVILLLTKCQTCSQALGVSSFTFFLIMEEQTTSLVFYCGVLSSIINNKKKRIKKKKKKKIKVKKLTQTYCELARHFVNSKISPVVLTVTGIISENPVRYSRHSHINYYYYFVRLFLKLITTQ